MSEQKDTNHTKPDSDYVRFDNGHTSDEYKLLDIVKGHLRSGEPVARIDLERNGITYTIRPKYISSIWSPQTELKLRSLHNGYNRDKNLFLGAYTKNDDCFVCKKEKMDWNGLCPKCNENYKLYGDSVIKESMTTATQYKEMFYGECEVYWIHFPLMNSDYVRQLRCPNQYKDRIEELLKQNKRTEREEEHFKDICNKYKSQVECCELLLKNEGRYLTDQQKEEVRKVIDGEETRLSYEFVETIIEKLDNIQQVFTTEELLEKFCNEPWDSAELALYRPRKMCMILIDPSTFPSK